MDLYFADEFDNARMNVIYSIREWLKNSMNKLFIVFAIIHIRIIQMQYKKITTQNLNNRTNQHISVLQLLQSKEYYYKQQFSAWGKFHPDFAFSHKQMVRHMKFMNWLFPVKDFQEWDLIIWHNPEAVTYYHNKIYKLQKNVGCRFEIEISDQIAAWKKESEKGYI